MSTLHLLQGYLADIRLGVEDVRAELIHAGEPGGLATIEAALDMANEVLKRMFADDARRVCDAECIGYSEGISCKFCPEARPANAP